MASSITIYIMNGLQEERNNMAELNEEQLLLLDNMMYYAGAASSEGVSVEEIARGMIEAAEAGNTELFSGGFESNLDRVVEIGKAILEDPSLCELYVRDSINTDGVRASCFVDSSGEATIAIRGTGGTYEAWSDNFQGAYQSDTTEQIAFSDFVKRQAEKYSDITITGHSKGGNLAQYATVVCGDAIDRCVSFDGQGFSDEFLRKYSKEISENADKIKSICASEDYVNILLFSIAGETVYLNADVDNFINNHSPYDLWKTNSGLMENGEFCKTVEQSQLSKALDSIADGLIRTFDRCDPVTEMLVLNFVGMLVASFMSGDDFNKNIDNIFHHMLDILKDSAEKDNIFSVITSWLPGWNVVENITYLINTIDQIKKKIEKYTSGNGSSGHHVMIVDCNVLDCSIVTLQQYIQNLEGILDRMEEIKLKDEMNFLLGYKLKKYRNAVEKEAGNMRTLQTVLRNVYQFYTDTERNNLRMEG